MSPDGSRIAYMSTRGGADPDVWLMNADGSNPVPLTGDEASEGKPVWAADGRRVLYMSNRDNTLGIWSTDVATRRHELLFERQNLSHPVYADGLGRLAELHLAPSLSRLAFVSIAPTTGRRRLQIATLSPFAIRSVTDGREQVAYPAWSPDERQIAVEIKDGSSMHAGVVDAGTGAVRRLTSVRGQSWVRSWSPDSRKIVMAAMREGRWDLRWIDVTTHREHVITPASPAHVYMRYPEWSPRGDAVLFERGELRGTIWTLRLR
jgi:TolB protein